MCVYCEVNEKGKRKKLFKKTQRIGSKGRLKSEAIIRKRKGPNKYFISATSWTGTYVHLLGEVICNYCPVCGREVNKKKEHVHEYVEVDRVLLNGFQASNGCSSEFNVTRKCLQCGKEETKWQLGY